MSKLKALTHRKLFLPIVSMILVMLINVIYDTATGSAPFSFFYITVKNGVLYGRLIDVLNRGSEIAILAIGMTIVVSASAGTDISVGSVMALYSAVCCVTLAGFGVTNTSTYARPLIVGILLGILVCVLCGVINGFFVAYLNIQPMVATLILWSAARAIGLLLCNNLIVYIRVPEYGVFGGYIGFMPTPIIIAAVCVLAVSLVLKKTAMGMYVQAVGINKKASRIAGLNSRRIIFMCYFLCGVCAAIAGIVNSSRITSADSNNIGLNMELDAILSVALGGNSLAGGKFSLAGSLIGAYTIQAITTTMYALGVDPAQAPVFKAVVVLIIVVIQAQPVKDFFAARAARKAVKEAA